MVYAPDNRQSTIMTTTRILIAEDEKWTRKSLSIILKKAGYKVCTANNGQEALDSINSELATPHPYDLLICDIEMPKLNGFDLIDELTKQNTIIPTLAMTGYGDARTLKALLGKGFTDFILKPFDRNELKEKVDQIINQP